MNTNTRLLKGSYWECFRHLLRAEGDSSVEKQKKIAAFVGVGTQTVHRWIKGIGTPVGESLVRLWFYLEHHGYEVSEIMSLPAPVCDTARLCAFRIVSLNDVLELTGYAGESDTILRIFRGAQNASKEKILEFSSIVEAYGEHLAEKQHTTIKVCISGNEGGQKPQEIPVFTQIDAPLQAVPVLQRSKKPVQEHEAVIESFAGLVMALIPLARLISSDEFSPEERAQVRKLAGGDGVFTLSNLFYRICGERAREMHSNPATSNKQKGTQS